MPAGTGWSGRGATAGVALALALAASWGCGRKAEEAWELPAPSAPGLAEGRATSAPEGGTLLLRRVPADGSERVYRLDVEHDVKVRGRGQSPLVISLREELSVNESEASPAGAEATVAWTVDDATVTVDPARDETVAAMEEDLGRVDLRRPLAATGVDLRGARNGAEAEVAEALARLLAPLPDRAVAPGDEWPLAASTSRTVDGGGEARVDREGAARFEGMVDEDGRTLALVTGRWQARPAGRRTLDGRTGGVGESRGEGLAAWLVDPETGVTVRAEAAEATLLRLDLADGDRTQAVEQLAVVEAVLRQGEAEP